jgi:hypothetical protein
MLYHAYLGPDVNGRECHVLYRGLATIRMPGRSYYGSGTRASVSQQKFYPSARYIEMFGF